MQSPQSVSSANWRFGPFELDVRAYQLRLQGRAIRLERRPMDLLILLVERRGDLVTRQEIIERLWGRDVFVDVDTGVSTVVWKVRAALRDSAESARYIETVPGRGYRFAASVEAVPHAGDDAQRLAASTPEESESSVTAPLPDGNTPKGVVWRWPTKTTAAAALMLLVALIVAVFVYVSASSRQSQTVSIAVLPFSSSGRGGTDQYLVDGISDDVVASLSQIDPAHLRVIARSSVEAAQRASPRVVDLADALGVTYVVHGRVAAEDDRVHVTATLVRGKDAAEIWSATYERARTELRGLQRDVSTAVAGRVRVEVAPERLIRLDRRQTANAAAYDAYLHARYFQNQRNRESVSRAIQFYQQAVTLDPDYALAWAGLSHTYAAGAINSDADPREVTPRARQAAANAIRANAELPESQFAAGYVQWLLDWNWHGAESAFRRAITLDASDVVSLRTLGHVLSQMGDRSAAESAMVQTRTLDPLSPMTYALSAQVAYQGHDYAGATTYAKRAILVDSRFWIGHMQLAQAYAQTGETDVALETLADAARFSGGENSKTISLRGYIMARLGRTVEAREALRALSTLARERYVPPYALALVHGGLGDHDAAFDWLNRAFDARDVNLIFLTVDPKWDPFRADERFRALLERCHFAKVGN